jgi:acetyl-CoA C-acetyltransferase
MDAIVLAGACRTAIGKFGGALSGVPAAKLGETVVREALRRANVPPESVDQVLMGCVLTAAQGQNPARQAAVGAGIPVEVPAVTIGNVCGSGLTAVNMAAALIRAGDADIVVAGGMENMSLAPYALPGARFGYRMNDGALTDTMIRDALWDAFGDVHMGITAENIAEKYGISRARQDDFAARSQQKCERARREGAFRDEIVPVEIRQKKAVLRFEEDEYPRDGVTAEGLAGLKSAFKPGGTVTAGNASGINDGAAAVVVMREETAQRLGARPMARFVTGAIAGCDPAYMGMGPVYAVRRALEKCGLDADAIGVVELNEAFAAQALAVTDALGLDPGRVNPNGGAIALGHPVGASGCRILVTLLHEMRRTREKYALASLCVGGGMGVATVVQGMD